MLFRLWLILAAVFALVAAPAWAKPKPKGKRVLAIKVNHGAAGDYTKIFNQAMAIGNESQVLALDWNELETGPGQYKPSPNFLAIANGYYPPRKVPIHLTIRPVHTNQKAVPEDLLRKRFDDPETIRRFKRLLDWVAKQLPNAELTSLTIGSEIDIYMWRSQKKWDRWTKFYAAVAPYARKKFPKTLVSCETTFASFSGPDLARIQALHKHSDAIGVSYYPLGDRQKSVRPVKVVHKDFSTVVKAIPKKPIIFYQIGYPSSPHLGSSERQQAQFMKEAFKAWDTHASRILMLNFQWMHETPKFGVDQYTEYYKQDNPEFRAFLGSLGLRSWQGKAKPAWGAIKKAAKARGFGLTP